MKRFSVFVQEMALPRDKDREKVYYHGTGEKEAQEIIKSGFLKGRDTQGRGHLDPMKGHTYITPHLHYAQIYGIGGDMAGSEAAERFAKSEHAYVFQIKGEHLKDIHPDEDSVGEKMYDEIKTHTDWHQVPGKKYLQPTTRPDPAGKHPWMQHMTHHLTAKQVDSLRSGDMAPQAVAGKKLNKVMADHHKYELIDAGAHIAHNGPLPVSRAWRVHKSKFKDLKRDGSNFFDHAEEVPLNK